MLAICAQHVQFHTHIDARSNAKPFVVQIEILYQNNYNNLIKLYDYVNVVTQVTYMCIRQS